MESRNKQEQILEPSRLLDQWAEENLDPATKYDNQFKAAKYEAYRQEGWTVQTKGLSGVKIPDSVIDISKSNPRDSRPGNDGR